MAVVAVGGYGRSQLFPFSDVDLLFLFQKSSQATERKDLLSRLLTDLWDSQLRISQSMRTPTECVRLAPDNAELHISLLDARFVAGDKALYDELRQQRLPKFYVREQKALMRKLVELTEARHHRYGGTIYHLEPNVKDGPGGLRDLQTACWIQQLAHATAEKLPDAEEFLQTEEMAPALAAKKFLFALRCYLHYFTGRDNNKLSFDLQDSIAHEGSGKAFRPTKDSSDWMRDYFRNVRAIDRFAHRAIDESATPNNSLFTLFRDRKSKLSNSDFVVARGRVFLRNPQGIIHRPELVFELFQFVARHGVPLAAEAERRIAQALPAIQEYARATEARLWPLLREILRLRHTYMALTSMRETGVLFVVFPEFELIDCLVVRDFYHRYTVDEHTFLTIDTLKQLQKDEDPRSARFCTLLQEMEKPEYVFLALLFHDVGKGTTAPNHAQHSAEIAEKAMVRLHVDDEERSIIRFLIEHHLTMSQVIGSRDLSDPETINQFVDVVGTIDRLKALSLVTFADTSAVNPTAMTAWRKELLWQLYVAAHSHLTRDIEDRRVDARSSEPFLAKAANAKERAALGAFLQGFPHRYLVTHSPEQVYEHFELSRQLQSKKAVVEVRKRHSLHEILVLTFDRPFLFASLCATMSSCGLNIEKAEAFSNEKGLVLDTFMASDPHSSLELNPNEITRLAQTLRRVARGEMEVGELLKGRRRTFRTARRHLLDPTVAFDNQTSSRATIFHVMAEDRVGLLFDLASKFSQHECNIEVVLIDTQGHKAIDVFYVVGPHGKLDEPACETLRAELLEVGRRPPD
jgi:[protein-PII] uridylyltransferase